MNKKDLNKEKEGVSPACATDYLDKDDGVKAKPSPQENTKSEIALREEDILSFWEREEIFNKTLEKEAPEGEFVFYDGPPFATGLPHYGHILAGTIKDAIPRFWTMNGYRVNRKWGWDCHGLPLENLIEKKLGLATKKDIEDYGIKNFNEAARGAVMEYADDWRRIVPRMGRFVDMQDDYKTMDSSYTESVWWVFSELNKKGLVYEGFKSMHLCPRCGTTLSNFEVNQGYKDIKDIAVTVKLPLLDEQGEPTDTSLLVWTTTPWTLPGNMAAAVNREFIYVKVKLVESGDFVVLAKERISQLGEIEYEVVEEFKGEELVGKSYTPPFNYLKDQEFENKQNAWKVWHADYVELGEEGTGAVHIAPAYGEDDMNLAKENNIPIVHHVDEGGHFMDFVTDFKGQLVKPKDDEETGILHLDADIQIVRTLNERGSLLRKENITHSYPHCWRCDTPLLNYATTSWFVRVTDIKDKLVKENDAVHWVPEHVGKSRFGKWLEGARDWAVSRQRYWGAPLPIWKNENTGEPKVFSSLKEIQKFAPKSGNRYFVMRHAESVSNTEHKLNRTEDTTNTLTEKGVDQVKEAVAELKKQKIDLVCYSPLLRTKETALAVAKELGLDEDSLVADDRIVEMNFGEYEGKSPDEYHSFFGDGVGHLIKTPAGGESWLEVKRRVGSFVYELEEKEKDKNILIVSHNGPLQMMQSAVHGDSLGEAGKRIEDNSYDLKNSEVRELSFVPMPHNDDYELDFHRPYIDDFQMIDSDGGKLVRIPDVFDCWFESGSMPYGQQHYPFENLEQFNPEKGKGYPAQFIAEGLDQTRGWFYSLIVLGTALFGKSPYENVIVNGLVLAEDGKKMSKKLQNYPDPVELVERQGADSMRYYLLSSPIIRGEDLSFSEKEVAELQRKNIGRLHNVLQMYLQYADGEESRSDSSHLLDRWMVARISEVVAETTAGYRNYELDKATRPLSGLVDDISVWYLRRSRDRLKGNDEADKKASLATLRYTLRTTALVMAPVMPFYAEYLWQQVKEDSDAESVHLADWPEAKKADEDIIKDMDLIREFATVGLNQRAKNKVNVRQPLSQFVVKSSELPKDWEQAALVLADELNVKEVLAEKVDEGEAISTDFDFNLTHELKLEGEAREFMRAVQDLRKKKGLVPNDSIRLSVQTSDGGEEVINTFAELIKDTVGATELVLANADGEEVKTGEHSYTVEMVVI